jgi:hypothetical protein
MITECLFICFLTILTVTASFGAQAMVDGDMGKGAFCKRLSFVSNRIIIPIMHILAKTLQAVGLTLERLLDIETNNSSRDNDLRSNIGH